MLIAHDVDPIELVVWLPALCRKMNKRCSGLRETEKLIVRGSCILTAEDMATLGVLGCAIGS